MKVIIFYSGKGGVGKSVISALVAKELSKKSKVVLIDADITGPSQHILFEKEHVSDNLTVKSIGFSVGSGLIEFGQKASKSIFLEYKKDVEEIKPDFVIIDTAPGITGVHNSITDVFGISGVIMISQKDKLSYNKVLRTMSFFGLRNIAVLGIVLNMVSGGITDGDIEKIGVMANIDYDKSIYSSTQGHIKAEIKKIASAVRKTNEVEWLNLKNDPLVFKSITKDDIVNMVVSGSVTKRRAYRFYNVETWDYVRSHLDDRALQYDRFLLYNTASVIEKFLGAFKDKMEAMVMVVRPPHTEIKLFGGEIGYGSLKLNEDSYYGVPRVAYHTDEGDVILFPHEVRMVDSEFLIESLYSYKEVMRYTNSVSERYIPTPEVFAAIRNQFGENISGDAVAYAGI